jgi:hypothetical protein
MKMEKLLDKHLPVKEERKRRFIFILFFFLLLGGSAWVYFGMQNGGNHGRPLADRNKNKTEAKIRTGSTAEDKNGVTNTDITPVKEENRNSINLVPEKDGIGKEEQDLDPVKKDNSLQVFSLINHTTRHNNNKTAAKLPVVAPGRDIELTIDKKEELKSPVLADNNLQAKNDLPKPDAIAKTSDLNKVDKDLAKDEKNTNPLDIAKAVNPPENKDDNKNKTPSAPTRKKNPKSSSFFISASAGPDLSLVGLSEPGRVKLVAGAGVGYTRGRFTLRSGFYTARKIYDAYPDDYHAPSAFYSYYPNLQKVKADCKVYELPLAISYNFGKKSDHSWFASTGISTYFMKRETYDFYYKYTATSPIVNKERTIYNSNEHWFSVVTVSGGYQKKINKTFSIAAEPYVKIPLTGIGFGKVKLNSAGILVSAIITPFHPRTKK